MFSFVIYALPNLKIHAYLRHSNNQVRKASLGLYSFGQVGRNRPVAEIQRVCNTLPRQGRISVERESFPLVIDGIRMRFCQRCFWLWIRSQGIKWDHLQRDACILPHRAHIFHRHEKMLSATPELRHRVLAFDTIQGDMAPLLCLCNDLKSPLLVRENPEDRTDPLRHMRSVEERWRIPGNTIQLHKYLSRYHCSILRYTRSYQEDMVE